MNIVSQILDDQYSRNHTNVSIYNLCKNTRALVACQIQIILIYLDLLCINNSGIRMY